MYEVGDEVVFVENGELVNRIIEGVKIFDGHTVYYFNLGIPREEQSVAPSPIAKIEKKIELLNTIIKSWKTKEMKHSHEVAIEQLEWALKLLKGE